MSSATVTDMEATGAECAAFVKDSKPFCVELKHQTSFSACLQQLHISAPRNACDCATSFILGLYLKLAMVDMTSMANLRSCLAHTSL